jgi:3-hydroxyisobutyrate dehydrogenase-like beta-hydroxyacid dehydrogenase
MNSAGANNVPLPGASLAHQMFAAVEAEGRGDDGTQSLVRIFERLAGLEQE